MTDQIRTFIALDIGPQIKAELTDIQSRLKPSNADVKWTRPDNIHLTLKFLGNVSMDKLDTIKSSLNDVAAKHKKFELSLGAIGAFPKIDHPRVVWVGLDKGAAQATSLAEDIEEALSKVGFEKEKRKFAAHLTLGRIRSPKNLNQLVYKIKSLDFSPSAVCTIDKITLYQSTLTSKGPIYSLLRSQPLL